MHQTMTMSATPMPVPAWLASWQVCSAWPVRFAQDFAVADPEDDAPAIIQMMNTACTARKNHMKMRLRFFTGSHWRVFSLNVIPWGGAACSPPLGVVMSTV